MILKLKCYYLLQFKVSDVNGGRVVNWKNVHDLSISKHEPKSLPVVIYYQDPNLLCYNYHSNFSLNEVESINYYFSIAKLKTIKGGEMYIYVHYLNQLVRNMRHVYKVRSFKPITYRNSNNYLVLDMRSISIMRSRKDAKEPCNESLKDDDQEWMKNVVNAVGCCPSYWENLFLSNKHFEKCKTSKEFKNAAKYHPRENQKITSSVFKMYMQPCDKMRVSINSGTDQYSKPNIFKIKFRFRLLQNVAILNNVRYHILNNVKLIRSKILHANYSF